MLSVSLNKTFPFLLPTTNSFFPHVSTRDHSKSLQDNLAPSPDDEPGPGVCATSARNDRVPRPGGGLRQQRVGHRLWRQLEQHRCRGRLRHAGLLQVTRTFSYLFKNPCCWSEREAHVAPVGFLSCNLSKPWNKHLVMVIVQYKFVTLSFMSNMGWTHWPISRSSQCSTTGVTKAVVCAILSVGWYI